MSGRTTATAVVQSNDCCGAIEQLLWCNQATAVRLFRGHQVTAE
ncbi:hypothetical protein [Paenibacillus lignilyticus]|nr:hypothetical protein [Paenibacillus lignilyticus]